MAYNTKNIKKDVDNSPIPQYYNPSTDEYEPLQGSNGGSKAILQDSNGEEIPINAETFTTPIVEKLDQLTGTVIDESTRQVNETQRKTAEIQRQNLYLEVQQKLNAGEFVGAKGDKGDKGDTGAGIKVLGVLNSEAELPATAQQGDAYIISNTLWVYTTQNVWKQAGSINNQAKLIPIEDAGENFQADNVEDALQEVGSKVNAPKSATEEGYPDVLSIPNSAVEGDMKVGLKGQTVQNLVKNGDFSEGTDSWEGFLGEQLSINSSGNLVVTGVGVSDTPYVRQKSDLDVKVGQRFYIKVEARVANSLATFLHAINVAYDTGDGLQRIAGEYEVLSPKKNRWYTLNAIFQVPEGRSGEVGVAVKAGYPDATTANGQSYEVKKNSFLCVDMGVDSSNPFYNKTVEEMDEMFYQWTDGLSSTLGSKRVRSLGKNLISADDLYDYMNKLKLSAMTVNKSIVDNRPCLVSNFGIDDANHTGLIPTESNTQYKINVSAKLITPSGNGTFFRIVVYYSDGTNSSVSFNVEETFTTFVQRTLITTAGKSVNKIIITFGNGGGSTFAIATDDFMITKVMDGEYEPYTEDIAYITAEKGGELQELRSLPNGVQDEIRFNADGNGLEFVRRIGKVVFDGSADETYSKQTEKTNTQNFQLGRPSDVKFPTNVYKINVISNLFMGRTNAGSLEDDSEFVAQVEDGTIFVSILKSKLATVDIDGLRTWLQANPTTVYYQLAQEEVTQIQWTGLTCKKDGTVLIETIVPEIGFYGTQATTKHPTQLIGSVDRLYKVDRDTGIRTRLDVLKCVIATDKLGFTHPDLADGDLLDWDYVPEVSYTQGYKSITVPTNMSATVEGLVENSKVQKENIRQLEYKVETAGKVQSVNGKTGEVEITKDDIGLDSVDNTADADKPVSAAQQTALNNKVTLRGDVMLGTLGLKGHYEKWISAGSDGYMSTSTYNVFYHTPTADTTYSFGAPGVTTGMYRAILKITMGTTAYALSWPTKVKWDKGVTPEALGANKTAVLSFMTFDNGATWYGKELWRES